VLITQRLAARLRFVIMKAQPVAQFQSLDQPVVFDDVSLDHLRLRLPVGIDAVKRVEHQIGVAAASWRPECRLHPATAAPR
jgi:hypothetical protein